MVGVTTRAYGAHGNADAKEAKDASATHGRRASHLPSLLFDKRGNASRPKLVFLVFLQDILIIAGVGLLLIGLGADGAALNWPALVKCAAVAAFFAALLKSNWGYTIAIFRQPMRQVGKIIAVGAAAFCLAAGIGTLGRLNVMTPGLGLTWAFASLALVLASRFVIAIGLRHLTRTGRLVRRTVIVGGGSEAKSLIKAFETDDLSHVRILGLFDDRSTDRVGDIAEHYAKLGNFAEMAEFVRDAGVDLLIVTVPLSAEERLLKILDQILQIPVDIRVSAHRSRLRMNAKAYSYIGNVPMHAVMDRPLTDWDRGVKNIEDRLLGLVILLLAAPVMALVALAIRLDSKGPVLFKQRRYGFNNELVEVYKFRSMYTDMTDATASKLVTRDDPRVTRVGRFIRKTSLDELPQLFNVLKGEMSLVGPRPHATGAKAQSDLYQAVVHGYFARHRVKPGVTGWAQVNGWRGETDTHEKIERRVEHDLHYIDNWSLGFDLYILAMTPISLLTGRNAY